MFPTSLDVWQGEGGYPALCHWAAVGSTKAPLLFRPDLQRLPTHGNELRSVLQSPKWCLPTEEHLRLTILHSR